MAGLTATTSTGSFLNDLGQARSGRFSLSPGRSKILMMISHSFAFAGNQARGTDLELLFGFRHLLLACIVVVEQISTLDEVTDQGARFGIAASSDRSRRLR